MGYFSKKWIQLLCAFLIAAIAFRCDTKNNVEPVFKQYYIKYFGEDGDQYGKDFLLDPVSNTLFIVGTSIKGQSKKVYFINADLEGNELVKKELIFSASDNDVAQDIELIPNGMYAGNFVIVSNVERSTNNDIRITVVNSAGDILISKLFNAFTNQVAASITPLSSGEFYLAGKSSPNPSLNTQLPSPPADEEDQLVVRFADDLTGIDTFQIGGSYRGSAIKIFEGNQEFHYAGFSDELTGTDTRYDRNIIFRTFQQSPNSIGSTYAGTSSLQESLSAVTTTPSGLVMGVGTQSDSLGTTRRIYAVVVSNNFRRVFSESVIDGAQREGVAVTAAGASRFLVLGNEFNAVQRRDIYLAKIDVNYNRIFEVRFGAPNNDDTASAVMEHVNGDVLILGTMQITTQRKIALIKLRSNGQF